MEISWLGHGCTRVRTRHATVVADPFERANGLDMGRPTADVVTVSHHDPLHDHVAGVRGQPLVIDGPGEYDVMGVQLTAISAWSRATDAAEGEASGRERRTAFLLEAEGLSIALLGAMGQPPSPEQAEALANADVLVVPIGEGALASDEAARTVRALEPAIVVPVSYRAGGGAAEGKGQGEGAAEASADPALTAFLAALGTTAETPLPKLSLQAKATSERQRVVLLEPRG
ncbi:MAG: MBL fold metallo-hydrolase [Chloroflexi bacterium]|nr:MBL fold metallo-hydrolase [Chloroflexota bacterium]